MQFDVYRNPGRGAELSPYLVDMQSDRLQPIQTILVAPLIRADPRDDLERASPAVVVGGDRFFVSLPEMFSIDRRRLGKTVANVKGDRERFVAAIDFLFTGI